MIGDKHTTGASARAERLRAMAEQAENLAALAGLAEAQLSRASSDLHTLAAAARLLAAKINCEGDEAEVDGAVGGAS